MTQKSLELYPEFHEKDGTCLVSFLILSLHFLSLSFSLFLFAWFKILLLRARRSKSVGFFPLADPPPPPTLRSETAEENQSD